MKKIILSSLIAILASSVSANSYLKTNINYSFIGEDPAITLLKELEIGNETTINRNFKGLGGGVSYGLNLDKNFLLELYYDYSQVKSLTQHPEVKSLRGFKFKDIKESNAKISTKESSFNLGIKLMAVQKLNDIITFSGGMGAGASYKAFEYIEYIKYKSTFGQFMLKSKPTIQPHFLTSVAIDFTVLENITSGLEYNFKYGLKRSKYRVKATESRFKCSSSPVRIEKDMSNVIKNTIMGRALKTMHSIAATIKFMF